MAWDRVYPVMNDSEVGVPSGPLRGDGREEVSCTLQLGLNNLKKRSVNILT